MELIQGGVVDFNTGIGGTEYLLSTLIWLGVAVLAYLRMKKHRHLGRSGSFQGLVAGFAFGIWLLTTMSLVLR